MVGLQRTTGPSRAIDLPRPSADNSMMPQLTLLIGGLLTLLGVGGYLLGFSTGGDDASWTALIPLFAGVPILICGWIAMRNAEARKHLIHAALTIALLGFVASLGGLFMRVLNPDVPSSWLAKTSVIGMLLLCLWLVVAGANSFIRARRERVGHV
jgi:hypothetical protein